MFYSIESKFVLIAIMLDFVHFTGTCLPVVLLYHRCLYHPACLNAIENVKSYFFLTQIIPSFLIDSEAIAEIPGLVRLMLCHVFFLKINKVSLLS